MQVQNNAAIPTPAEKRILTRLLQGLTNEEIARGLGVSGSTVRSHLHSLFLKTRVRNRTALSLWALRNGYGQEALFGEEVVSHDNHA